MKTKEFKTMKKVLQYKKSVIPENLYYLRVNLGLSLEQVSEDLNLKGKSSYLAYEEGRAIPDIFKLIYLSKFYEVELEKLVLTDLTK